MPLSALGSRDTGCTSPYPLVVFLSAVVLSVIGLVVLMVLGTAVYGIVWALGDGLASFLSDARDRLRGSTTGTARLGASESQPHILTPREGPRSGQPDLSTEAMLAPNAGHVEEVAPEEHPSLSAALHGHHHVRAKAGGSLLEWTRAE